MAFFFHSARARRAWVALLVVLFLSRGPARAQAPAAADKASASPTPAQPGPQAAATAEEQVPASEEAEGDSEEAEEEDGSASIEAPAVARGSALARQAASVQKQIGRARAQSGFFISSWFSDAPEAGGFATASALAVNAPEDCEPLDATIAEAYIRDSAKREGVSSDLIREVVRKESGFKPCAVSPKGAMGMMQLTAATAAALGVDDPYDPRQNIDGGVRLMKRLIDKYKGRPDLALAAYNAGEGAVDAHQGVPAYEETQEYVSTIMKRVFEVAPKTGGVASRAPARIAPIPPVNVPPAKTVDGN